MIKSDYGRSMLPENPMEAIMLGREKLMERVKAAQERVDDALKELNERTQERDTATERLAAFDGWTITYAKKDGE